MGYKNNDLCWDNADDDEPIFVGLGRDPLAAVMTLVWAVLSEDCQPEGQIVEAQNHAERMMAYCRERNPGRRDERFTPAAVDRAIMLLRLLREEVEQPVWREAGFDSEEEFGAQVLTDLAEMDEAGLDG